MFTELPKDIQTFGASSLRSRSKVRIASAIGTICAAAIWVAGCTDGSQIIDSRLYGSNPSDRLNERSYYMGQLCAAAGVRSDFTLASASASPQDEIGFSGPRCPPDIKSSRWTKVLYAGILDIDGRCSAYLDWLYNTDKKLRARQERLTSIQMLTVGLMGAYNAGNEALVSVGLAFGFGEKQLLIKRSRLLLEYGYDGVQRIVDAQQLIVRKHIADRVNDLNNIFAVEDALKLYLKTCLPRRIEANIKTNAPIVNELAAIKGDTSGAITHVNPSFITQSPIRAEQRVTRRGRGNVDTPPNLSKLFKGQGFDEIELVEVQKRFCLQGLGIGHIGNRTKAGARVFEEVIYEGRAQDNEKDGKINDTEYKIIISNSRNCNHGIYKNYFENAVLSASKTRELAFLRNLDAVLRDAKKGKRFDPEKAGLNDRVVRDNIEEVREVFPDLPDLGKSVENQATLSLQKALRTKAGSI